MLTWHHFTTQTQAYTLHNSNMSSSSSSSLSSSSPSPPRRSMRLAVAGSSSPSPTVSNSNSSESTSSSSSSSSSTASSSSSSSSLCSPPSSPPCCPTPTPRDVPPMHDDDTCTTLLSPPSLPSSSKFNRNPLFYREAHGAGNLGRHHRFAHAALNGAKFHPNTLAGAVGGFQSALFSANFSRDGQMLFTACQDGTINLYDLDQLLYAKAQHQHRPSLPVAGGRSAARMYSGLFSSSSPSSSSAPPVIRPKKRIRCQDIGWSIVGSAFSPDAKWIAYSSWSRLLHLTNTFGEHELHERVLVSPHRSPNFCLFSLAFSADGAQVIGGGNDGCVHLIQLERKAVSRIENAHFDDVNTVCFVDPIHSPSLVLSGADDGLIKLWDLRAEGAREGRAQGLLAGHVSGVTSVCSKDGQGGGGGGREGGRLVVSNGKDQTSKLWDLRKVVGAGRGAEERYAVDVEVDYRFDISEQPLGRGRGGGRGGGRRHPVGDHSIRTWRGHRVMRTLIQAAFSSEELTGGRFVVTGSAGGKVFVYDTLGGEEGGEGGREEEGGPVAKLEFHQDCVRTVAFAPHHDLMVSAGWDGRLGLWGWQGREEEEE